MEELLAAFLSKTLNIDDSKFAELVKTEDGKLKEDALKALLDMDKDRVKNLKGDADSEKALKERFDNGYAKGVQESLGKLEKKMKEQFSIDSDKKGIDLVNEIVDAKTEALKSDEVNPEKVKKSKTYLDMVEKKDRDREEEVSKVKSDFEGKINKYERDSMLGKVNGAAMKLIKGLNPILSSDPVKADNQIKMILDKLSDGNYKIDGDRITMLNAEGKLLEDEHGNPLKFDEKVKSITTSLFDLNESKDRSSGGDGGDGGDGDSKKSKSEWKWDGSKPKDAEDYAAKVGEATSLEEKQAIQQSFKGEDTE